MIMLGSRVLPMTLSVCLVSGFVISLARTRGDVLQPTLGSYPGASLVLSAEATVTPDAAPTNTTSINVFSSTNFKGRLEGDPATGVVRVTNAHPAGSYIVTVQAFGGGASVIQTFTLTVVAPATCTPISFAAATNFSVFSPRAVAVGDFNRDGKQDLAVVTNDSSNNVVIFLGNGAGSFGAATYLSAGIHPISVVVGDFNGDGKQDLAIANNGSGNNDSGVSVLLGNGAGGFATAINLPLAQSAPFSLTIGDFDGDGRQDLAVANFTTDNVAIFLGDGTGHFSAPTNFPVNLDGNIAVGDFNSDGKQDLALVTSNGLAIMLGNGAGSFSSPTYYGSGLGARALAVGDFNGDGKQDVAMTDGFNGKVSIFLGDGNGLFSAPTRFSIPGTPSAVVVGDFNGDGNQDLAVVNGGLSILLGDGNGIFGAATSFSVGSNPNPLDLAVGDFNGDGKQDLVTANNNQSNVAILLRDCALTPPPKILSITRLDNGHVVLQCLGLPNQVNNLQVRPT